MPDPILLLALAEMDKRYQQRFEAQEKAIAKAEMASEKRFEGVNEFRAQLTDQATTFLPRTEYYAAHNSLSDKMTVGAEAMTSKIEASNKAFAERIDDLRESRDKKEGQSTGINASWVILIGAVALIESLVVIFLAFKK